MATIEVTRDHPSAPLPDIDPAVHIPDSVRRAAAAANAHYTAPQPEPVTQAAPAEQAGPVPGEAAPSPQPDAPQPEPQPQPDAPQPVAGETVTEEQWKNRYKSMEGRWKQSQKQLATVQDQMSQLGDELLHLQSTSARPQPPAPPAAVKLITPADEEAYGTEIIDLVHRAAREVVEPELNAVKAENADLKRRVVQRDAEDVYTGLDTAVPDWRAINTSPKFKNWLRLRDFISGRVRQGLLNEAFQAADAPRVAAFFKDFIKDEVAMGSDDLAPQPAPQPAPVPVPRVAAVSLESLVAPGKARPASGDSPVPGEKPVFTRAQISAFYAAVRRGVYAGRDADKASDEALIFAAQREGRVRG